MRGLTEEEIKKGWIIHDQIKNHDFRKMPEQYLLEEYDDLIKHKLYDFICGWGKKDIVTNKNGEKVYEHSFCKLERKLCNISWSNKPEMISIDVWSNPNIALINEAMHDYNGIRWRLASIWRSGGDIKVVLSKYIETTELMLMIFHKLLDGEEISEVKYPKNNGVNGAYSYVKFVRNPRFNNYWTHAWAAKEGFYVD